MEYNIKPRLGNDESNFVKSDVAAVDEIKLSAFGNDFMPEGLHADFLSSFNYKDMPILTKESIVQTFFLRLAKRLLGETDEKNFCEQIAGIGYEDVQENPVIRLYIGPTFQDMLFIFSTLWGNAFNIKLDISTTRRYLSSILDSCIDAGCIVPVFNNSGQRIYRKGEAPMYDSGFFNSVDAMCIVLNRKRPNFLWQAKAMERSFSKSQRAQILKTLNNFEF